MMLAQVVGKRVADRYVEHARGLPPPVNARIQRLRHDLLARRDNFMVAKSLREASALHRQLRRAVAGLPTQADPALPLAQLAASVTRSAPISKAGSLLVDPPGAVLTRLQRAVAAGWADQVRCTEFAQQPAVDRACQIPCSTQVHHAPAGSFSLWSQLAAAVIFCEIDASATALAACLRCVLCLAVCTFDER